MAEQEHLAQSGEEMMERNFGHIARRGREVEVWVEGIPDPRIGFLAGMDAEFIQLCISDDGTLSNVRRDMIVSVDETGVTLGAFIRDSRGTPDEVMASKIREKVVHFQSKATAIYGGSR